MAARTERPQKRQENYLHRRKESYMASANNQQITYLIDIVEFFNFFFKQKRFFKALSPSLYRTYNSTL